MDYGRYLFDFVSISIHTTREENRPYRMGRIGHKDPPDRLARGTHSNYGKRLTGNSKAAIKPPPVLGTPGDAGGDFVAHQC